MRLSNIVRVSAQRLSMRIADIRTQARNGTWGVKPGMLVAELEGFADQERSPIRTSCAKNSRGSGGPASQEDEHRGE